MPSVEQLTRQTCDAVSGTVDSQTVVMPTVEQLVMRKLVTDRVEHISTFIHVL